MDRKVYADLVIFPLLNTQCSRILGMYARQTDGFEINGVGEMKERIEDLTREDYRNLIEGVQNTRYWFQDFGFVDADIEVLARRAAKRPYSSEFRLRHGVTGARLYLRFPEPGSPSLALKGFLEQPFDKGLDPDSAFGRKVGVAHAILAEELSNQYISPIQGSETVLSIDVPPGYRLEVLEDAADAAGQISIQVQSLHREIRRPVESVLRERTG